VTDHAFDSLQHQVHILVDTVATLQIKVTELETKLTALQSAQPKGEQNGI
jgi:FtsZ-binding cell division protein ZapB